MPEEVTKKDLQSLQGYCNKQIADVEKRLTAKIADLEKSLNDYLRKAMETLNKNDAELLRGHTDQMSSLGDQSKRIDALKAVVDQHTKAIKALE